MLDLPPPRHISTLHYSGDIEGGEFFYVSFLGERSGECMKTERPHAAFDANVESPGGISPPRAPRRVREPLNWFDHRCSAVAMT